MSFDLTVVYAAIPSTYRAHIHIEIALQLCSVNFASFRTGLPCVWKNAVIPLISEQICNHAIIKQLAAESRNYGIYISMNCAVYFNYNPPHGRNKFLQTEATTVNWKHLNYIYLFHFGGGAVCSCFSTAFDF